jgi:hypothetical protein
MSTFQAFLLGIMVALTPSMIVVALILWRVPPIDNLHVFRRGRRNSAKIVEIGARKRGIYSF